MYMPAIFARLQHRLSASASYPSMWSNTPYGELALSIRVLPRAVHSCAQISKMAIEPATMKVTELKDELTKRGALDDLLQFPWVRMMSNVSHRFPCMYAPPSLCSRPLSSGLSCPLHQFLA